MIKIDFKKIRDVSDNFLNRLVKHAFLTLLTLFCIALLLGEFLFYKYALLNERKEPEISGEIIQFKDDLYRKVLGEWQTREEKFKSAGTKEYPDPFKID